MKNNQSIDPDRSGFNNFNAVFATVEFIVGQIAKTIVVFCRYDFGERYFRIGLFGATVAIFFVFGFAWMFIMDGITRRPSVNPGDYINANSAPIGVFLLGFLIMSFIHQAAAWLQSRVRPRWHSRYSGTSFITQFFVYIPKKYFPQHNNDMFASIAAIFNFVMPDSTFFVKRYVEPLLFGFLGFLITFNLNAQLGFWLIFASLCLATHEQILAMRDRDRILNAIDAQIEGENLAGAISGNKTPQETEGFVLPVPKYFNQEQREKLAQGMQRLDPALEAILDKPDNDEIHTTDDQNAVFGNNPYLWNKQ